MKSSLESTSASAPPSSLLVGSGGGGLNKVGDRRKTRHSIKNFEVSALFYYHQSMIDLLTSFTLLRDLLLQ